MTFIVHAFIIALKTYGIKVVYRLVGNTYEIDLYDLPASLDIRLLRATFRKAVRYENGNPVMEDVPCCEPSKDDSIRVVHMTLNEDDFAAKINVVDSIIFHFIHDHR